MTDSTIYYQRRAAEERRQAQAARDSCVAMIHRQLAERYDVLAMGAAATPPPMRTLLSA